MLKMNFKRDFGVWYQESICPLRVKLTVLCVFVCGVDHFDV